MLFASKIKTYKKQISIVGTALVALILIAAPTTGWVAASKIIAIQQQMILYDQRITAVDDNSYTIRGGAYNIMGIVGGINPSNQFIGTFSAPTSLDANNKTSVRTLIKPAAAMPKVGDILSLQGNVWNSNPKEALGVEYQNVTYKSKIGNMNAWLIPGSSNTTWTVGVHGIGADKNEMLRFVKPVLAAGDTMMIINYRNDPHNPQSPDGRNNLGDTEWQDLESAVDYARSKGATTIRLYGDSLGGSIVMNFLKRTDQERQNLVSKVVLDSPALNWGSILRNKATQSGYPEVLYYPTALMLQVRTGIDLDAISTKPEEFKTKTLIIHSADDQTVPQLGSKQAAQGNPDKVTLVDFGQGGHLRSWNRDSARYEKLVTDFLK